MRFIDPKSPFKKGNFPDALEEFKSLIADPTWSINDSFFCERKNVEGKDQLDKYWWKNIEEVTGESPLIYNNYRESDSYRTYLASLSKKIKEDFINSTNYLKTTPQKILYLEAQKYYFQNIKVDYQIVEDKYLASPRNMVLPKKFLIQIPHEIIDYYQIDEELQFHIEKWQSIRFILMESIYTDDILEFIDRQKEKLMLAELSDLKISDPFFQIDLKSEKGTDDSSINESKELNLSSLPDQSKRKRAHLTIQKLDIRQTALFFYYLRKFDFVLDYADDSFAKIINVLTGHSEQNIRTKKGFGVIGSIKNDEPDSKPKYFIEKPNHNLEVLKSALLEIIKEIDNQIEKNTSRKK